MKTCLILNLIFLFVLACSTEDTTPVINTTLEEYIIGKWIVKKRDTIDLSDKGYFFEFTLDSIESNFLGGKGIYLISGDTLTTEIYIPDDPRFPVLDKFIMTSYINFDGNLVLVDFRNYYSLDLQKE